MKLIPLRKLFLLAILYNTVSEKKKLEAVGQNSKQFMEKPIKKSYQTKQSTS